MWMPGTEHKSICLSGKYFTDWVSDPVPVDKQFIQKEISELIFFPYSPKDTFTQSLNALGEVSNCMFVWLCVCVVIVLLCVYSLCVQVWGPPGTVKLFEVIWGLYFSSNKVEMSAMNECRGMMKKP